MQKASILLCIAFSMLMSSCNTSVMDESSKNATFETLYPNCSMNSDVVFMPLQPSSRTEDSVTIGYKNVSNTEIAFPLASGVRIYTFDTENAAWIAVGNRIRYSTAPQPYIILDASGGLSSYHSIDVSPDVSSSKYEEVRVVIIGSLLREDVLTDKCVGAFIDIQP